MNLKLVTCCDQYTFKKEGRKERKEGRTIKGGKEESRGSKWKKRIKRREKEDGRGEKRKEKLKNIYLKHHRRTCKSKLTFDYLWFSGIKDT